MTPEIERRASYKDDFVWAEAVSYKKFHDGHNQLDVVFRTGINEDHLKAYETELILYDEEEKNRKMLSGVSPEAIDKLESYITFYLKLPQEEWQKRSKALETDFENMIVAVTGIAALGKGRREK